MLVFVCVEVYDGHRDGMSRGERPGSAPTFLNDDIHFANPAAPSGWDRRFMGYFAVDCPSRKDVNDLIANCYLEEGAPTLRIVWSRTTFSASELRQILQIIPKDQLLEAIPRMTLEQFNASTIPVNSTYTETIVVAVRDKHAADKAEFDRKRDAEPTGSLMKELFQSLSDDEEVWRQKYAALAVEYSKRKLFEEPETLRRAEIIAPPKVKESKLNNG